LKMASRLNVLDSQLHSGEDRRRSKDLNPGHGKRTLSRCFLPLFQTSS
jgi:hypothetical protein